MKLGLFSWRGQSFGWRKPLPFMSIATVRVREVSMPSAHSTHCGAGGLVYLWSSHPADESRAARARERIPQLRQEFADEEQPAVQVVEGPPARKSSWFW